MVISAVITSKATAVHPMSAMPRSARRTSWAGGLSPETMSPHDPMNHSCVGTGSRLEEKARPMA